MKIKVPHDLNCPFDHQNPSAIDIAVKSDVLAFDISDLGLGLRMPKGQGLVAGQVSAHARR